MPSISGSRSVRGLRETRPSIPIQSRTLAASASPLRNLSRLACMRRYCARPGYMRMPNASFATHREHRPGFQWLTVISRFCAIRRTDHLPRLSCHAPSSTKQTFIPPSARALPRTDKRLSARSWLQFESKTSWWSAWPSTSSRGARANRSTRPIRLSLPGVRRLPRPLARTQCAQDVDGLADIPDGLCQGCADWRCIRIAGADRQRRTEDDASAPRSELSTRQSGGRMVAGSTYLLATASCPLSQTAGVSTYWRGMTLLQCIA